MVGGVRFCRGVDWMRFGFGCGYGGFSEVVGFDGFEVFFGLRLMSLGFVYLVGKRVFDLDFLVRGGFDGFGVRVLFV